jgi:malonyl CoA-acyl carrier protein transacylase
MTDRFVRDTGLVFALVALVFAYFGHSQGILVAAVLIAVVLFAEKLLRPIARIWFMVAEVMGTVLNYVFFTIVFTLVVVPVGVLMRIAKGDHRDERARSSRPTAFTDRDAKVTATDLIHPF